MEPEFPHRQLEHGIPAQVLIYPQAIAPPVSAAGLLLVDLLAALLARLRLVLGSALGGAVVAVLLSLLVKPQYEATAIYAPATTQESMGLARLGGLGSSFASLGQMAGLPMTGPTLGAIEALVESREITIEALRKEDMLPILFPSRWDEQTRTWRPARLSWLGRLLGRSPQNRTGEPTPDEISRYRLKIMKVETKPMTNTIIVKVRLPDPEAAARLANRLAYFVNESERKRARTEAEKGMAYLRSELEQESHVNLHESIGRLLEAQMEAAMLADSRDDYAVRVIDPAVVPQLKVSPKRSLYGLFGLLAGGLIATIIAVRLEQSRRLQGSA